MFDLYYNLVGLLYLENDYRISKLSLRSVNLLFNFIDSPKLNFTSEELGELGVLAE